MLKVKRKRNLTVSLVEIRQAIADYMASEGCSCCQDADEHKANEYRIGKLLQVPSYSDGSGFDFSKFRTKSLETVNLREQSIITNNQIEELVNNDIIYF